MLVGLWIQVQLAGLQTLRNVAQAGLVEQPRGEIYAWALFILHRLTTDVISIVYNATQVNHQVCIVDLTGLTWCYAF